MAEAKTKYTVKNTTILHNKKSYATGATIELTDNERDKLIDYIDPVAVEEKEVSETNTTKTPKSSKKSEKVVENASGEETNDEKKEDVNGSETIQTPAN